MRLEGAYRGNEHAVTGMDRDALSVVFLDRVRHRYLAGCNEAGEPNGFQGVPQELRIDVAGGGLLGELLDLWEMLLAGGGQVEVNSLSELVTCQYDKPISGKERKGLWDSQPRLV